MLRKFNSLCLDKAVVNMSTVTLSSPVKKLLSKGTKFVPKTMPTTNTQCLAGVSKLKRRMHIDHFFYGNIEAPKHPFKKSNPEWNPPTKSHPLIDKYICSTTKKMIEINKNNKYMQTKMSIKNCKLLRNIKELDVIIKPADKGGALVILDKESYLKEAERQLKNVKFYKACNKDNTSLVAREIKNFLLASHKLNAIDAVTLEFMLPPDHPRTPPFYMLPKIHKKNCPGRPIISGCDSPTDNMSRYLDHFLKPAVPILDSYIKDTGDFLKLIHSYKDSFPKETILVTIDVKSLYTCIPHEEGIQAACDAFLSTPNRRKPPLWFFKKCLSYVLKYNFFEFNGKFYRQITGTAMGTRMAPSFACIFMGYLEKRLIEQLPVDMKPLVWKRYIDDIFVIWPHGVKSLQLFFNFLDSFHGHIKFEYSSSLRTKHVHFLDTTVYFDNEQHLKTTLHTKPTDNGQLLHNTSEHPFSCKCSVIFSQAIRLRKIISDEADLHFHLCQLKVKLILKGYKGSIIDDLFQKALLKSQEDLIFHNYKQKERILPFVIPYNNTTAQFRSLFWDYWSIIAEDDELKKIWKRPPVIAFKRSKNIKDYLVHSRLRS